MSAHKGQRQPKAQKVKLHEIEGHKLTPKQFEEYMYHLAEIGRRFPGWANHQQVDRALRDCLYRWRPSVRAHEEFRNMKAYERATEAVTSLAALAHIPIHIGGKGTTRVGNELIEHVATELELVALRLRRIHLDISNELGGAPVSQWSPLPPPSWVAGGQPS